MIETIRVNNVASYDEVGIEISNLKAVNFIYGANGSGKTTISNLLANSDASPYSKCSLSWNSQEALKCLVYNKKFREDNFGTGKVKGVFTLGTASQEELQEIEKKKQKLEEVETKAKSQKTTLDQLKEKKETEEEGFKEIVWKDIYKKYEIVFKDAFKGVMQKQSFKLRLLQEYVSNTIELQDYKYLTKQAEIIFGEQPSEIIPIGSISFQELTNLENDSIWSQKIIGKTDVDISKLIQKLNLNDWVNQGRSYIHDQTCPFCQAQTITEEFKGQLESYFDETYVHALNYIRQIASNYRQLSQNLINELEIILNTQLEASDSKLDTNKFEACLRTLTSQINENYAYLANKENEPSRSIHLTSTTEQLNLISALIVNANIEIEKHNKIVINFKSEKVALIHQIWGFITNEHKALIDGYNSKVNGLKKGIENIEKEVDKKRITYRELKHEITELTKNVTSIQPTVDEINKTLKYYGFENFEIAPVEGNTNEYWIKREDGALAEPTLSEGEVTFITFLYFLQLAKGSTDKENITENRILVIDDPISSLDSNVLFVVSTLIKEIIKALKKGSSNIKQLILLTHNVYFHKEVSFIDGRTKEDSKTHFWILRKNNKVSTMQAYDRRNPIQTSYELLWNEVKNRENVSNSSIQNTMRKIIENYFKILGGYGDDDLIQNFDSQQEREICRSLISWINDGSHSVPDDLYVEAPDDTIDVYLKVFEDIFRHTKHHAHYKMMMGEQK